MKCQPSMKEYMKLNKAFFLSFFVKHVGLFFRFIYYIIRYSYNKIFWGP